MLSLSNKKVVITIDAEFQEDVFPFKETNGFKLTRGGSDIVDDDGSDSESEVDLPVTQTTQLLPESGRTSSHLLLLFHLGVLLLQLSYVTPWKSSNQ